MLLVAMVALLAAPPAIAATPAVPLASWEDLLRAQIARHLEAIWGAPVRFKDLDLGMTPPTLTLRSVECSTRLWGWQAELKAERLTATPALWSLMRGSVEWERLEIDGFEINAAPAGPGQLGDARPASRPLIARKLEVARGVLRVRAESFETSARFSVQGATPPQGTALEGQIHFDPLRLERFKGIDPTLSVGGSGAWAWSETGMRLGPLDLRGDGAEIRLSARFGEHASRVEVDSTLAGSLLPLKLPESLRIQGPWRVSGVWEAGERGWHAGGTLRPGRILYRDRLVGDPEARWQGSGEGLEIAGIVLRLEGAEARVGARLGGPAFDKVRATAEISNLSTELLALEWPGTGHLQGRLTSSVTIEAPLGGGWKESRVRGTARLSPRPEAAWPLGLESQIEGEAGRLSVRGTWRMEKLHGGAEAEIEAAAARLHLTLAAAPVASALPSVAKGLGNPLPAALAELGGTLEGRAEVDLSRHPLLWTAQLDGRQLTWGKTPLGVGVLRASAEGDGIWRGEARLEQQSDSGVGAGEAVAQWRMEAQRPDTLAATLLADVTLPDPLSLHLRAAGTLAPNSASQFAATLDSTRLGGTAHLALQRRERGEPWTVLLSADDGGEGWASLRLEAAPGLGVSALSGQVARWRLPQASSDPLISGMLAEWLEVSAGWVRGASPRVAAVRLLEAGPDGTPRPWAEGDLEWQAGSAVLALERASPPLKIRATVDPSETWPFSLQAEAPDSEIEVAPGGRLRTSFGGRVDLNGTLRPWTWEAGLALARLAVSSGGTLWLSSGPVRGSGSAAGWSLEPIELRGEAGDLKIAVNPQNGELTGRGFLSAAAVARWVGGVEAEGRLEADLRWSPLRGGSGSLRLEGMRILSDLLPFPVEALSGAALLEGSRLRLEGVRGQSASGSFELSGEAPVSPSSGNWDLELAARQIPLRQPPGLQATADARLRLQGSHGSPRLAGEVKILQGVYTLPLGLGRGVPRLSLDPGAILPGMLSAVGLDVALSVQHLWMRSEYTRLECHGNVRLSGTVRRPVLGGQVAAVEGGELRFNQVRYRVSSGLMELTGSERNDPRISLNAETERGEYTLFLQVRGTLENLQVALRSDPPLPTAEVVRLLTTGREAEPGDTPAGALAGGLVGSVVGGRVLTPLQSGLQSFLPVDRLEIDPLAVSGQGDPTARITLGKQLSRRVSLSYSSTLGNNQEDLYQLRYRLQPDLDLTASREDDGSIGGDLRHSRRFYPPGTRPAREPQEARPLIRRVRFRGDSPLSRRRMRAAVTLIPGEPASLFELVDSQEKVWRAHARAGYPQAVIRASLRPRRRDSADAVFEIEKGSPLQIRLEGAPLPRALEAELLDLWQEVDLRALVAARAEARIAEHFRQQGYPAADARLRAESRQPDSELWIFDVHTGRRAEVRSLRFEGASRIPERDLLAAIETRADFPGDRGLFIASRLLSDTNALRRLYAEHGYRDAEVELEPPHFSGDGREALVSWRIEEGLLYTVAKVEVSESAASLFEDALETLRLIPGAPFSERTLAEDQNRLAARLDRRGYPQARVEARVEGVPEALRIRYEVEPGPRRLVGEVRIEGNRITRDSVIRKELAFAPGDPLSQQRLEQSQRNLYELGVFRSVSVEAQEAESDPAGVRVRVIESAPLTLGAGVGYDSVDRFRGRLDISNRNLFGTRRYAGGVARAGSTERRIQALLRDPRLFGSRLAGLASWFYEEEEGDTFDVIRRGARLQIEQRPSPRVTLFYRYALSEEDLSEVSVTTEAVEPEQRLAHLGWSLAYDSRDDFADPHRGLYGSLDLKWFSETLASQAEFARVFLQASYYRSLGRRLVWASGLRFGVAEPLGADSLIPITERFFAGGDNSVRGFKRDRLGPIDPVTGDPLGGELSILVNQELRFPVWRFLRGVVFYDGGSVVAEPDDFQRRSLRHVLGAGVRFDTPLGPVRLDYGRLLDRQTGEEPGALHFSIGHAF